MLAFLSSEALGLAKALEWITVRTKRGGRYTPVYIIADLYLTVVVITLLKDKLFGGSLRIRFEGLATMHVITSMQQDTINFYNRFHSIFRYAVHNCICTHALISYVRNQVKAVQCSAVRAAE